MKLKIFPITVFILFITFSVIAQTSADLQAKYGKRLDAYEVRPNILGSLGIQVVGTEILWAGDSPNTSQCVSPPEFPKSHILMTVEYANDGQILEAILEPHHTKRETKDNAYSVTAFSRLSPKLVTEIIDELIPATLRGRRLSRMSLNSSCNSVYSEKYERVEISRAYTCNEMTEGASKLYQVRVHWNNKRLNGQDQTRKEAVCTQSEAAQNTIFEETEKQAYTFRRTEFVGAEDIRRRNLYRRLPFNEGDIFTRELLVKSLVALNRYRALNPVKMKDVKIEINRADRTVDLWFCISEKRK